MNKQQKESSHKTEHKTNDNTSSQDTHINSELKSTQEAIKCKRILELDKSIRYAGMCASDGTLVASEYKKEITPLINGTELGLKTCKNIIEQHKGKMAFTNHPTTFTVMLPK